MKLFTSVGPNPRVVRMFMAIARDNLAWLNQEMTGRQFVCGDRFTFADVLLHYFVRFGFDRNQPLEASNEVLIDYHRRISERPSAKA